MFHFSQYIVVVVVVVVVVVILGLISKFQSLAAFFGGVRGEELGVIGERGIGIWISVSFSYIIEGVMGSRSREELRVEKGLGNVIFSVSDKIESEM